MARRARTARRAFAQLYVVGQLRPFLDWLSHSSPGHPMSGLLQCMLNGASLNNIQKLQVVQSAQGRLFLAHVTSLLCELHWLLVCYWRQFKVLAITSKACMA